MQQYLQFYNHLESTFKIFLGHFPNLLKYSDCCNVAYAMDKEIIKKKNWLALFLNSRKLGVDFQNWDYFGLSGVTFIFESSIQNWEYDFFGGEVIFILKGNHIGILHSCFWKPCCIL